MNRVKVKAAAAGAIVLGTLTVTGCGSSGLMHDGSVAATYGGTTVSNTHVQQALTDVRKVNKDFDAQSAVVFLALNPRLSTLAGQYGVATSKAQATAAFPAAVKNPSTAAIEVVQASMDFQNLRSSAQGQPALDKLIATADVRMNPRYGTWKKGYGPTSLPGNWMSATPTDGV